MSKKKKKKENLENSENFEFSSPKKGTLSNENHSDKFLTYLQEIFFCLDDDNDGYISSNKIELLRLPPKILEIIQDILVEMEEKDETLDFSSFLNKIEEFRLEIKIFDVLFNNFLNEIKNN